MNKIFLAIIFSVVCIYLNAQDMAQWRGPNRNGVYAETGLMKKWPESGPPLLWHFDELGEGHTSAAVSEKSLFITGMINGMGNIFSFDNEGKLLWRKEYGKEWDQNYTGTRSTPLVVNNKLYILSTYGKLICINCSTGQFVWIVDIVKDYGAKNLTWGLTENLISDGNVLYCTPGGSDVSLIALDMNTGKLIWKSKGISETSGYCSPIIIKLANKKVLITIMQKSICGFDASTGILLWKFNHINDYNVHPNIPVYYNGYLLCTSETIGAILLRLSPDGLRVTKVWENDLLDPVTGGVVIINDRIFGASSGSRRLYCLDLKSGKELYSTRELSPASIISNEGLLYIYSESGRVSIVQPMNSGFNIVSSFKVPFGTGTNWSHLVLKNKKMYVRHGTSMMVYNVAEN